MHTIGAFFSNRSNEPDPSTNLVLLNIDLHRQIRDLSSKDNTQTNRIKELEEKLIKKRELVKSQKALLKDLNRKNTDLASRISELQNEPDPVLELASHNRELHSQIKALSSTVDTQAHRIQDLEQQISSDLKKIGDLQKEYDSYWIYTDELIQRAADVSEVIGYVVGSAVDIAEGKRKDKPLETKVKTLEADLSSIITQRNILRTQRNILAISLAVFAGSFVFFKLKK